MGQLNWIATNSRPDIVFDTCELSTAQNSTTIADVFKINKLVHFIQNESLELFFPRLHSFKDCTIECYTDAAFANLPNGESQGGIIIFLKDDHNRTCPIFWQSRQIRRRANLILIAETLALLEGSETAINLNNIISQMIGSHALKINCYTDCKSLYLSIHSSKQNDNKKLRLDINVLEDMLESKEINTFNWVSAHDQVADCLTKKGVNKEKIRAAVCKNV